jgi:hypothetical protein
MIIRVQEAAASWVRLGKIWRKVEILQIRKKFLIIFVKVRI